MANLIKQSAENMTPKKAENVYKGNTEEFCFDNFFETDELDSGNSIEVARNQTECFENGFPWTTFPTRYSPIVRLRSFPIHPRKIDPQLLMYDGMADIWVKIDEKKWKNFYDRDRRTILITHGWSPENSAKTKGHLLFAKEFFRLMIEDKSEK